MRGFWPSLTTFVPAFLAIAGHHAAQDFSSFSHQTHVNARWWEGGLGNEYVQDCQTCHDYTSDQPRALDATLCASCHAFESMDFRGSATVDPSGKSRSLHRTHVNSRYLDGERAGQPVQCRDCHGKHLDTNRPRWSNIPVPVLENSSYCDNCHEDRSGSYMQAVGLMVSDPERLDRPFSHALHLWGSRHATPPNEVDPERCTTCHTRMSRADAPHLNSDQFDTKACEKCHLGAEFGTEPVERPSRTAATFLHGRHLRTTNAEYGAEIRERGCMACHAWDEAAGPEGLGTFSLQPEFQGDAHQACIRCHETRAVPNHGQIDVCSDCHDIVEESLTRHAAMRRNRPVVEALRPEPASFVFERQQHPFLTGGVDEACSACHRADLEWLGSRLERRPFQHATHVPPLGDDEQHDPEARCDTCHGSIAYAAAPETGVEGHGYDGSKCAACHGEEASRDHLEFAARPLMRFTHANHLSASVPDGASTRPVTCFDCHEESKDGSHVYSLRADVADCTRCHGHGEPDKAARSGELDLERIRACRECHPAGIPPRGEPIPVGRLALREVTGSPGHPTDSSATCSDCHLQGREAPSARADDRGPPADRLAGRYKDVDGDRHRTPHQKEHWSDADKQRFDHRFFADVFRDVVDATLSEDDPRGAHCLRCHWHDPNTAAGNRAQFLVPTDLTEIRKKYGAPERNWSKPGLMNLR